MRAEAKLVFICLMRNDDNDIADDGPPPHPETTPETSEEPETTEEPVRVPVDTPEDPASSDDGPPPHPETTPEPGDDVTECQVWDCSGDVCADGYLGDSETAEDLVGDGTCDELLVEGDLDLNCEDFDFDGGDCEDALECTPGDVNGDTMINVLDVVALVGQILGTMEDVSADCANDVTGDGSLNVLDVVALVNTILIPAE